MEHSSTELNELSDEILMIIFTKLEKHHILSSLIGVNQRLIKIAHDSIFTSHLTLFEHLPYKSISRLSDSILDRFCSEIIIKSIGWILKHHR